MSKNEIYLYENKEVKKFFLNALPRFSVFSYLPAKIGVISYKDLVFLKKEFPRNLKKQLKTLIKEEIEVLFPYQNMRFFYQILSEQNQSMEIGIWIYDNKLFDQLIQEGCVYVVPEPLIFYFEEPTLLLYQRDEFFVLMYTEKGKVFNFLTSKSLSKEIFSLFLKGLNHYNPVKILIYADVEVDKLLEGQLNTEIKIEIKGYREYPIFLDYIDKKFLKKFKVRNFAIHRIDIYLLARIIIYIFLALSMSNYLSIITYEREIAEIEKKISHLKTEKNPISPKLEYEKFKKNKNDIFYILSSLSKLLPEGSNITRLNLSEDSMILYITTSDPFIILNNLHFEKCFLYNKLLGPTTLENGKYRLEIKIGLHQCRFPETN
ncbi:MAG: hypothetical protein NC925_01790 [Candidatus Omnitrophica bacterium]|nr:hypothetical protein [Candidatus Omnitrophota bacterium]